jgi:hypothetical protein
VFLREPVRKPLRTRAAGEPRLADDDPQAVEPARGRLPMWWLGIVTAIGGELFYAFGLFQF